MHLSFRAKDISEEDFTDSDQVIAEDETYVGALNQLQIHQVYSAEHSLYFSNARDYNFLNQHHASDIIHPDENQSTPSITMQEVQQHTKSNIGNKEYNADATSHNSDSKIDLHVHGGSVDETIRIIVNNDRSWFQIRQQMKDARLVTSLGVQEVCAEYITKKAEEIRIEKMKETKKMESMKYSNLSKLRKRLSIFG